MQLERILVVDEWKKSKGQISTSGIRTGDCRHITSLHSLSLFTSYDGSLKKSAVGSSCCYKLRIVHSFYYFALVFVVGWVWVFCIFAKWGKAFLLFTQSAKHSLKKCVSLFF